MQSAFLSQFLIKKELLNSTFIDLKKIFPENLLNPSGDRQF